MTDAIVSWSMLVFLGIGLVVATLVVIRRPPEVPDARLRYVRTTSRHFHERVERWRGTRAEHVCWCGELLHPGCNCPRRNADHLIDCTMRAPLTVRMRMADPLTPTGPDGRRL